MHDDQAIASKGAICNIAFKSNPSTVHGGGGDPPSAACGRIVQAQAVDKRVEMNRRVMNTEFDTCSYCACFFA